MLSEVGLEKQEQCFTIDNRHAAQNSLKLTMKEHGPEIIVIFEHDIAIKAGQCRVNIVCKLMAWFRLHPSDLSLSFWSQMHPSTRHSYYQAMQACWSDWHFWLWLHLASIWIWLGVSWALTLLQWCHRWISIDWLVDWLIDSLIPSTMDFSILLSLEYFSMLL